MKILLSRLRIDYLNPDMKKKKNGIKTVAQTTSGPQTVIKTFGIVSNNHETNQTHGLAKPYRKA